MHLHKGLIPILISFSVVLSACSSEQIPYKNLIDEYEAELARAQANEAIKFATELTTQTVDDVVLPTFMSYPIPMHYQNYHRGLGIDVTKLNYSQEDWLVEIKKMDQEYAANKPSDNANASSHGHHH